MNKRRRVSRGIVVFLAAALVLLVDALMLFSPDLLFSPEEKRNLQQFPSVTLSRVFSGRFAEDFDRYVADQFPFRAKWVEVRAAVDRMLGKTKSGSVFLGSDGYLIQDFPDYSEENRNETLDAAARLAGDYPEIRFSALIAPTALSVCADKLPELSVTGDENGFLDAVRDSMTEAGIDFVDVRAALADEYARGTQVYYRTDHHWTTQGAHAAYLAWAEKYAPVGSAVSYRSAAVSDSFTGTLAASSGFRMDETDEVAVYLPMDGLPLCRVTVGGEAPTASLYDSEALAGADPYTVFFGGNYPLVTIDTAADSERVLLVIKDSYANCFAPFLLPDYQRILMVDPRYFTDDLGVLIESEGVTDALLLYNAESLANDVYIKALEW